MTRDSTQGPDDLLATRDVRGDYYFLSLRPKNTGPVQVAFGGKEQCGGGYLVQRSSFPFITVEYVVEGQGRVRYGNGDFRPLRPGSLFTHGPGQKVLIQGVIGSPLIKHFVCITGKGARELLGRHVPIYGLAPSIGRHADLEEAFAMLVREGRRHTPFTSRICDHLLRYTLQKIAEVSMRPSRHDSPSRARYLKCKALIDDAPLRIRGLQEISARVGIEQSGLCRLFKRYQGVSPYQYLLRRKMSVAAEELIKGGGLIREAAERLGYSDPYHFSRVFKSVHGTSPARFIRKYATGN